MRKKEGIALVAKQKDGSWNQAAIHQKKFLIIQPNGFFNIQDVQYRELSWQLFSNQDGHDFIFLNLLQTCTVIDYKKPRVFPLANKMLSALYIYIYNIVNLETRASKWL